MMEAEKKEKRALARRAVNKAKKATAAAAGTVT
jgi:hypothetical protein